MIGRSHQPWWQQLLGRAVRARMVHEATDFDLHIVALDDEEDARMTLRAKLLLAQAPLARGAGAWSASWRVATVSSLGRHSQTHPQGQLPQRAGRAADEGGDRAHAGQRRAAAGRGSAAAATPAGSASGERFESELRVQEGNITEPGEARAAAALRAAVDALPDALRPPAHGGDAARRARSTSTSWSPPSPRCKRRRRRRS